MPRDPSHAIGFGTSDLRRVLVWAFLIAQAGGIVWGRVSGESFWSWAPHDSIVDYAIDAWDDGEVVPRPQVEAWYGLPAGGRRYEPAADLIAIVRIREARLRRPDACTRIRYRVNGGDTTSWSWPEGCEP